MKWTRSTTVAKAGGRNIKLQVNGAFHTKFMEEAAKNKAQSDGIELNRRNLTFKLIKPTQRYKRISQHH